MRQEVADHEGEIIERKAGGLAQGLGVDLVTLLSDQESDVVDYGRRSGSARGALTRLYLQQYLVVP
jgi:hypothetical protein